MLKSIWGKTTDPSDHDPKNFRYLVHGVYPRPKNFTAETAAEAASAQDDQSINLYEQPERVSERVSLSMSLIDPDHTGTWAKGGLILEVPEENIIGNGPSDLGSANSDPSQLRSQFRERTILTPEELLRQSSTRDYNEVIAFANLEGSKVKLKGFYITVRPDGSPVDSAIAAQMQEHATALNLSLVKIEEPPVFSKSWGKAAETVTKGFTTIPADDHEFRW